MANAILKLPAVKMRTRLSRSSIYLWISKGKFPAPVSLGARAVGWVESEVDEWIPHRIMESRERNLK
jgi:prophage regulatory protein